MCVQNSDPIKLSLLSFVNACYDESFVIVQLMKVSFMLGELQNLHLEHTKHAQN